MAHLRLPSTREVRDPLVAGALSAIAAADAAFDSGALLRELPDRFAQCCRALADGDADRLHGCPSPSLFEQWQKGEALPASTMAELSAASVEDVRLVWAERRRGEDRMVVGIDCLRDSGGDLTSPTEYWPLVRPSGAQTPSALPDECPDCGGPVTGETAFCRYCGSALGPLHG
jgi:hypothetical protein